MQVTISVRERHPEPADMQLDTFSNSGFDRGASRLKEVCWVLASIVFSSWLPGSGWRASVLRLFGASVGKGVVIKPLVRVKFPWRLSLGDHTWLGESSWIDNLADVVIEGNACVSQGAYICTGSHDWTSRSFDLIVRSVHIGAHSWIGACGQVAPGARIGEGAVLTLGSVATGTLEPWTIYAGNPARAVRARPRSDAAALLATDTERNDLGEAT